MTEVNIVPKFKYGDRVVAVNKNNWVPVGTVGTVVEDSVVPFVEWDNGNVYCLRESEMKLYSPAIKKGDRIRLTTDKYEEEWELPKGTEGTVFAIRSNCSIDVDFDNWEGGHDGETGNHHISSHLYVRPEELEKTEKQISDQVETLYFSALVTEETIRLLEKNLESMKKLLKITQNSVDVGVAEQTDADQLQVQVSTMESTIKTTHRSLEMVYNSLRLQLCLEEDVDIVLTQGIDDLLNMNTTSELLASPFDINDNYDYRLLKENTELVRKQIALTGWSNGPTVSVYHQYNARHNFSNEATMNMTPPNMLGAQVNIPLFTFGKNYAAIKEAKLTYKKQLNTLEDTELSLNVQYRQMLYNLRNAIEKYEIQKQNVDVAQRVFDNIAKKYEFGVASSLDVTNSGTNLISAQSTYVQSLLEIVNAQISLEQLLNK